MEEFKDIFDYIAYGAFQIGIEAPNKPQYTLRDILRSSVGGWIEEAMAHYLIEQNEAGLIKASTKLEAHEVVEKFEKLYNLGVFLFEAALAGPHDVRLDLFVWDGESYKIIGKIVSDYLLETEKLGEEDEI